MSFHVMTYLKRMGLDADAQTKKLHGRIGYIFNLDNIEGCIAKTIDEVERVELCCDPVIAKQENVITISPVFAYLEAAEVGIIHVALFHRAVERTI